jgi:RNA polymerase primary sigma factor
MDAQDVEELLSHNQQPVSLSVRVSEDREMEFGDLVEDADAPSHDSVVQSHLVYESLMRVLGTLSTKERNVMVMRFGLDGAEAMTVGMIASYYGVSSGHISTVLAKTMSKLRHPSRAHILRTLL